MNRKLVTVLSTGALVAALATGSVAFAAGGDDGSEGPDVPISGTALDRATAAALDYIGEGRVTGTEEGDEESYYEVEITRDDGSQVDVQLDKAFTVVGDEAESSPDDD